MLWVSSPAECAQALAQVEETIQRCAAERQAAHKFYPPPERLYQTTADWWAGVESLPRIDLGTLAIEGESERTLDVRCAGLREIRLERGRKQKDVSFEPVAARLQRWCDEGDRVFIIASSESQAQRIAGLLEAHEVESDAIHEPVAMALEHSAARPHLLLGHLAEGFRLPDERVVFVTEGDLFGEVRPRRRHKPIHVGALLRDLNELRQRRLRRPPRPRRRPLPRPEAPAGRRHRGRLSCTSSTPAATGSTCPSTASIWCRSTSAPTATRRRSTSSAARAGSG